MENLYRNWKEKKLLFCIDISNKFGVFDDTEDKSVQKLETFLYKKA